MDHIQKRYLGQFGGRALQRQGEEPVIPGEAARDEAGEGGSEIGRGQLRRDGRRGASQRQHNHFKAGKTYLE